MFYQDQRSEEGPQFYGTPSLQYFLLCNSVRVIDRITDG
jgi:hypothetical protein